jgi:hypothetical protein
MRASLLNRYSIRGRQCQERALRLHRLHLNKLSPITPLISNPSHYDLTPDSVTTNLINFS